MNLKQTNFKINVRCIRSNTSFGFVLKWIVSIPTFSLDLYLYTSTVGNGRKLQKIIEIQPFDDADLTISVQNSMYEELSSKRNSTFVSMAPLSPCILKANKTDASPMIVWISCNYSGVSSFSGDAPLSNELGQLILNIFGTSPSMDEFISALHSTNNSYLQMVNTVNVELLSDPSSSSVETGITKRHASSLPYAVGGSVVGFIILSVSAYFLYKKTNDTGHKNMEETPSTPPLDMSPEDNDESAKQIMDRKSTNLLGIEAKDVYMESCPEAKDLLTDNLSSICFSLNRILEERGLSQNDPEPQPPKPENGIGNYANESPTEDLSWTLIPGSNIPYDEYDMRNCCTYNPMENEATKTLFDLSKRSNPLYHDLSLQAMSVPLKDSMYVDPIPAEDLSQELTPMPKQPFETFDMRNRDGFIPLEEEPKTMLCGISPCTNASYQEYSFPKMPLVDKENTQVDSAPPITLQSKMSYEEYDTGSFCACTPMDEGLKKRLFGPR